MPWIAAPEQVPAADFGATAPGSPEAGLSEAGAPDAPLPAEDAPAVDSASSVEVADAFAGCHWGQDWLADCQLADSSTATQASVYDCPIDPKSPTGAMLIMPGCWPVTKFDGSQHECCPKGLY